MVMVTMAVIVVMVIVVMVLVVGQTLRWNIAQESQVPRILTDSSSGSPPPILKVDDGDDGGDGDDGDDDGDDDGNPSILKVDDGDDGAGW